MRTEAIVLTKLHQFIRTASTQSLTDHTLVSGWGSIISTLTSTMRRAIQLAGSHSATVTLGWRLFGLLQIWQQSK
jgi:hypothetical protein